MILRYYHTSHLINIYLLVIGYNLFRHCFQQYYDNINNDEQFHKTYSFSV